jgi:hypothetical protein
MGRDVRADDLLSPGHRVRVAHAVDVIGLDQILLLRGRRLYALVDRRQTWVVCACAEVPDDTTISAAKTVWRTSTSPRGVLEPPPSCYLAVLTRRNPR